MRCAARNAWALHCWLLNHFKTKSYIKCPRTHIRHTAQFSSAVPKPNTVTWPRLFQRQYIKTSHRLPRHSTQPCQQGNDEHIPTQRRMLALRCLRLLTLAPICKASSFSTITRFYSGAYSSWTTRKRNISLWGSTPPETINPWSRSAVLHQLPSSSWINT